MKRFSLSRKNNPAFSLFSVFNKNNPVWTRFNQTTAANKYTNIDIVFSAIDMICRNAAQAEFSLFQQRRGGEKQEVFDHELLTLLRNPNSDQSAGDFLYSVIAWHLISGQGYINANVGTNDKDDFRAKPLELWNFRSDRMQVIPGDDGLKGFKYTASETKTWAADEISGRSNILMWKSFNPTDDYYGLSRIQAAMMGIDIYDASLQWNKGFLDNGACPSSAIIWKGENQPSEDVRNQLEQQLRRKHSGGKRARLPMVLSGNFDFKDLSVSPKDMDFINAKTTTATDIVRVFSVPPILLNIGSDATYANMAEAKLDLWDSAVIPLLKSYVSYLNKWLTPRYGNDLKIELNLSNITALEPRRQAMWERAQNADYLTVNEKRNMVGLGDEDGGDVIFVPATSIPLTFAADPLAGFGADQGGIKKK